jgi:hypothetical protein
MRTYTGIVKGQAIEKNLDGEQNVRMLQVEITEPDDVQGVQQITWPGDDNAPVEGDTVVILEISETYKVVIGVQDQIEPAVESGERKLYSQDGGAIKSFLYFKKDGQMILNGTGDNAVRFSALETAFNDLLNKWNTFANAYVPGGPSAVGSPPSASASSADISTAKINTIEVPS